jgi:membrane protease subunit (stomatin/prohibitin family)
MARKRTLGYVRLEWTCPNCSTRNEGGKKTCQNCGASQPENLAFEQPAEKKFVEDAKGLAAAAAGADIHCGFCGTRNPANATACSQCGSDLKEGKQRLAGGLMQPEASGPKAVTCTRCGTENPSAKTMCAKCGAPLPRAAAPTPVAAAAAAPLRAQSAARKPSKRMWAGIIGGLLVVCVAALLLFVVPTSSVQATVSDVHWQTSVPVEELQVVSYTNESGSPPSDAYDVACHDESREVCEQKTIDRGNGYAEVVEECRTETEQYCDYRRDEWRTIQTYTEEGSDFSPVYSQPTLATEQRLGEDSVEYTVFFETEDGSKTYSPDALDEFVVFAPGSVWTLRLNALGGVRSVER